MTWLEEITAANGIFRSSIDINALPVRRAPGPFAIITCMDPRVNLQSVGIDPFKGNGASGSNVRVIRTLGGMAEDRSLAVGIHLAGFKEVAVLMHTDCGCSLAYTKIDVLIDNLCASLGHEKLAQFKAQIGEPFRGNLRKWLCAFQDPRQAVSDEVKRIKAKPYVPADVKMHGLLYHLGSGEIEVVVDGGAVKRG